jgi:hypothetical protein
MLAVLSDPAHEEYEKMRDWLGDDWNPEHYDIAAVNETLATLAMHWNKAPQSRKEKGGE